VGVCVAAGEAAAGESFLEHETREKITAIGKIKYNIFFMNASRFFNYRQILNIKIQNVKQNKLQEGRIPSVHSALCPSGSPNML